ncbi:stalk domain-containing protein [Paenibacillus sp. SI8]|uniref:stalk domain-containing protein n=1 Tax=unclassified Paenibacillus TaxID=185978 RepID=UPI00346741C6
MKVNVNLKVKADLEENVTSDTRLTVEMKAELEAIENGSTVVPVQFVSEALKAAVNRESETQSVVTYEK